MNLKKGNEKLFAEWDKLLDSEGMPAELHPSRGQLGISQLTEYAPKQGRVEEGGLGMDFAEIPVDRSRDVRNRLEYPVDPITLDCMYMHLLNIGKTEGRDRPWNKQLWVYRAYDHVFDDLWSPSEEFVSHTEHIVERLKK